MIQELLIVICFRSVFLIVSEVGRILVLCKKKWKDKWLLVCKKGIAIFLNATIDY